VLGGSARWLGSWLAFAALVPATSGCWLMLGLDDNEYTRESTAPPGIRVSGPSPFYIDATETTIRAYVDWLHTNPSLDGQDARCVWNDAYEPGTASAGAASGCLATAYEAEASTNPNRPARCIDWCDALAFCSAKGKRLCGRVGGGSLAGDDVPEGFNDAAVSQWFAACTGPDQTAFPYGQVAEPGVCRDALSGYTEPGDVGTPSCEGGFPGLFDMSGNVQEWVDVCFDGGPEPVSDQGCFRAGGSYDRGATDPTEIDCGDANGEASAPRKEQNETVGFRCCSDA
jgi:formylglycine-generating enzyme required for sulfatase activity